MDMERIILKKQRLELPRYRERIRVLRSDFPFAWWVSLDWRKEPDVLTGINHMAGWLIYLARKQGAHLMPCMAYEPIFTGKRFSLHMVLLSDRRINVRALRACWKHGYGHIKIYKHDLGGSEYTFGGHMAEPTRLFCSGKKPCKVNRKGKVFCTHELSGEVMI